MVPKKRLQIANRSRIPPRTSEKNFSTQAFQRSPRQNRRRDHRDGYDEVASAPRWNSNDVSAKRRNWLVEAEPGLPAGKASPGRRGSSQCTGDAMKIIPLQQGSDQWLAHRRGTRNQRRAGDDGRIALRHRAELDPTARDRRRSRRLTPRAQFDRGHEVEPALRAYAERILGEDLYPITATGDDGYLGASFDGVTLSEEFFIEAKQPNAEKMAQVQAGSCLRSTTGGWCTSSRSASRPVRASTVGDGSDEGTVHLLVTRGEIARDIPKLLAGWAQFDDDVAAYQPSRSPRRRRRARRPRPAAGVARRPHRNGHLLQPGRVPRPAPYACWARSIATCRPTRTSPTPSRR